MFFLPLEGFPGHKADGFRSLNHKRPLSTALVMSRLLSGTFKSYLILKADFAWFLTVVRNFAAKDYSVYKS